MEIKNYILKMMTQWKLFQFALDTIAFADNYAEGMPQTYADKLEELRAAFNIYDQEVAQQRMPSRLELLKADDDRDYAIRKMYQLILYYSDYRYDAAKEHAAKGIKRIFKSYGTGSFISRQAQDVQTTMISLLLKELARPMEQQHVVTLGLTEVMLALDTSNRVFNEEQMVRNKILAAYVTDVQKHARIELQKQIMEFVALINALAVVEGEEKYAELKQIINSMVKEYMAGVGQRSKKKKEEEE